MDTLNVSIVPPKRKHRSSNILPPWVGTGYCFAPLRNAYQTKRKTMVYHPVHHFSFALTDASTGHERREYVDTSGTTWVKGEKGDEFFIILENKGPRDAFCKVLVDGVNIGFGYNMPRGRRSTPIGVLKSGQSWSDTNLIMHALRFVEKSRDTIQDEDDYNDNRTPSAGSVTVEWYACEWDYSTVEEGMTTTTHSWSGKAAKASSSSMHKKEQSQLRSEEGSAASSISNNSKGPRAKRGELLASTPVQYTSDFGLAVRGLLAEEECGMSAKRQKTCISVE